MRSGKVVDLVSERLLMLAETDMRFHRDGFDALPTAERRRLVVGNAECMSNIAKAAREREEFIERARVGSHSKKVWIWVRAAELRDIERLTLPEIARELGVERSTSEKMGGRYDVSNMRRMIANGRTLLDQACGGDGSWRVHAEQQRKRAGLA